jgi:hypothetical protein
LTFSILDEGYSNLLTFSTWWRLFQSFELQHLMKVIPIFRLSAYLMKVIPIFWLSSYLMTVIPIFW